MNAEASPRKKERFDLTIVTAFGRHNWLVRELSAAEWKISVLDIGPLLGTWRRGDLLNPFGLSRTEELTEGQLQYFIQQYNSHEIENGVAIRVNRGPIEGKGPLADFHMSSLGFGDEVKQYFSYIHFHDWRKKMRARQFISGLSFDESWLVHLANQVCATRYYANHDAILNEEAVAFFSTLWRDGYAGDKNNLSNLLGQYGGVQVNFPTGLGHFHKYGGEGFGVEYQIGASQNVIPTRMVLWGLSSIETQFLSKDSLESIYSGVAIEPAWSWQAFELRLESEELMWPEQFYFCDQMRLPWTHENLGLVSRLEKGVFSVHVRIPRIFRFNKEYLQKTLENLKSYFVREFPGIQVGNMGLPIDAEMAPLKLGPPRLPVYDPEDLARLKVYKNEHFFLDTFENIKTHQLQAQLVRQGLLLDHFTSLRRKWLGVEARQEQRRIQRQIRNQARRGKEL